MFAMELKSIVDGINSMTKYDSLIVMSNLTLLYFLYDLMCLTPQYK